MTLSLAKGRLTGVGRAVCEAFKRHVPIIAIIILLSIHRNNPQVDSTFETHLHETSSPPTFDISLHSCIFRPYAWPTEYGCEALDGVALPGNRIFCDSVSGTK